MPDLSFLPEGDDGMPASDDEFDGNETVVTNYDNINTTLNTTTHSGMNNTSVDHNSFMSQHNISMDSSHTGLEPVHSKDNSFHRFTASNQITTGKLGFNFIFLLVYIAGTLRPLVSTYVDKARQKFIVAELIEVCNLNFVSYC